MPMRAAIFFRKWMLRLEMGSCQKNRKSDDRMIVKPRSIGIGVIGNNINFREDGSSHGLVKDQFSCENLFLISMNKHESYQNFLFRTPTVLRQSESSVPMAEFMNAVSCIANPVPSQSREFSHFPNFTEPANPKMYVCTRSYQHAERYVVNCNH